ncbi:IS110 family transposase [Paraburkholderia panacisoli]|uniref:IS110 family transposase n=1 Tax=Paraburkholderia panacisoli TaxID=2603818 RepID=A0A5B0GIJ0_9BURK|nr:IS110 family transposase [Paraburkholderia panacisoli]KAA1001649.1 IS110 family transposase [Paraburkholderia panacisoli]
MATLTTQYFAAFVGIDWGDTKHDFCLQASGADRVESGCIPHRVECIDEWARALHQRFGGPIALALELAKGPIVSALQKYDFFTLFPINPSTLAKYRQAFRPGRAKDDPSDAELALDLLLRHPERFAPLRPQSAAMRSLTSLNEQRRELVGDRIRFTNRLRSALKQYFPQTLDWFEHIDTMLFCDFLTRWPTLPALRRASSKTLEAFFRAHHCGRARLIDQRLKSIRSAVALTDDPGIVMPYRLQAVALVAQLRATLAAIDMLDEEIAALARTLPDFALFDSLPGAGPHLAPRLLAAFGEQRERFRSALEVQQYTGIAPVTERSGKKSWVHWRWQCPTFLRQTFVEWAGQTINKSFWAGAYYRQQRAKGSSYQAAVRALAFKWIRILYRCWQTGQPYNESAYLNALRRRGSPLLGSATLPGSVALSAETT